MPPSEVVEAAQELCHFPVASHEGTGWPSHVPGDDSRRHPGEPRVLVEYMVCEQAKVRTRLDAKFLDEVATHPLVGLQRFRLAAGPIEGEHELTAQALTISVAVGQDFELADKIRMSPQSEVRLEPLLQAGQAQLLQPPGFSLRERLVHHVGEGEPAPQRERRTKRGGSATGVAGGEITFVYHRRQNATRATGREWHDASCITLVYQETDITGAVAPAGADCR